MPVGMGIVVPAQKIIETLEQQELKEMRESVKAMRAQLADAQAASPDSALPLATTGASPTEARAGVSQN